MEEAGRRGLGGKLTGLDLGGALALVEGVREHVERCGKGRRGEEEGQRAVQLRGLSIFSREGCRPFEPGTAGLFSGFLDHSPATP